MDSKRERIERAHRLATRGVELHADVDLLRGAGFSWRAVAMHVTHTTGIAVSHESVRQWFGIDADELLRGLDVAIDAAVERGDRAEVARLTTIDDQLAAAVAAGDYAEVRRLTDPEHPEHPDRAAAADLGRAVHRAVFG